MGVPELAFRGVKGFVEGSANHVFNPDKTGVGVGSVVDEALADVWYMRVSVCIAHERDCRMGLTFVKVRAIMIGFYAALGI